VAGRSESEAAQNFLDPLQRSFSCVTHSILFNHGGYHAGPIHVVTVGGPGYADLPAPNPLQITLTHHYRIVEEPSEVRGPWKVSTVGYIYEVVNRDGQRIIAYHWHPMDHGTPQFPHLHVGLGSGAHNSYAKPHYPTGRVALEQVLRLLIVEFGVEPRRDDWADILDDSQAAYEEWRTRPGSRPQEPSGAG
jgi:hypothetical protein